MKKVLEKHVLNILSTLKLEESFEVYDCNIDDIPNWAKHIQITHEYLIIVKESSNIEKLQKFLQREVYQNENGIYWFDGDRITTVNSTKKEEVKSCPIESENIIDYLKTETRLPKWLDDYIFDDLKAEYCPDFKRFEYNLDLTENENLKYLGTYFPRSYAESFCIFDNIFQNKQYRKNISQQESLNILSIGCGTGGDLIGLITVIQKYSPKISNINIWAVDGNSDALSILEKVVNRFSILHSKNIKLTTINSVFNSIENIDIEVLNLNSYDFIITFKMICEIISAGRGRFDNSYYDFTIIFLRLLSKNGLCLLLDVTTKAEHIDVFNPILMNLQVNKALRELKEYQTLLPLSCNKNENRCFVQCFTQQKFYVSHKAKVNDLSKVSYRIIGKASLITKIHQNEEAAQYILQKNGESIEKVCPYAIGEKVIDSYKLNR